MLLEGNGLYPPLIILPHGGGVREFIWRCTSADAIGDIASGALRKTVSPPSLHPSLLVLLLRRSDKYVVLFFFFNDLGTGKQSDSFPPKIHAQVGFVKLKSDILNGLFLSF